MTAQERNGERETILDTVSEKEGKVEKDIL
jgi:hypothetical protein